MSRVVDRRRGEFRVDGEGGRVVGLSYGRGILNQKSGRLVKQRRAKGVLPKRQAEKYFHRSRLASLGCGCTYILSTIVLHHDF